MDAPVTPCSSTAGTARAARATARRCCHIAAGLRLDCLFCFSVVMLKFAIVIVCECDWLPGYGSFLFLLIADLPFVLNSTSFIDT
jgi:hypothetical protein